ncbi:MAG: hypothetical protein DME78_10830 [Verrucomicrobia bacterium]|nr:MAG: hypothetical protein DME78_10830 [Verrucomicrobiota bacterium]
MESVWQWRSQAFRPSTGVRVLELPVFIGCCRRVVVRQAFEYFKATARRVGIRSPGANAPNEKPRPAFTRP